MRSVGGAEGDELGGERPGGIDVNDGRPLPPGPLPDGPLPVPDFLAVAIEIAWALDDWHRTYGTHGALCPELIDVDGSGSVRVCPPGPDAEPVPEYTAPEQTGRLDPGVDGRADLYAAGMLLHRLLTGRLPLRVATTATPWAPATPAQWRQAHLTRAPTPPAELVAELPPA